MTRIGITCIQLVRDLQHHRAPLDERCWEVVPADIAGQHLEGDELIDALDGCVGVVAGDDKFTRDVLERLPELKVISKWGIGIDGIDLFAAADCGITVRNTPGMFDDEVADVTMAYVVNLLRQLGTIDRGVRSGSWPKPAGRSLGGLTIGIVGLGGIGRAVAARATAAGMNVIGCDPSEASCAAATALGVTCVDQATLWAESDVISINCPLNPATHHLVGSGAIALMRQGVYIVNTGRGPVIDTDALVDGLRSGRVAGAALDVMETEPLPADHALTTFDQVMFGSHNASNTLEASARVHGVAIANLIDALEGSPE
jgi:D-3-phosphoglycerate dehydrogenase / 2-oxoglutarate reductase